MCVRWNEERWVKRRREGGGGRMRREGRREAVGVRVGNECGGTARVCTWLDEVRRGEVG